jgi:PPOX class probable F420-dependent enzyme
MADIDLIDFVRQHPWGVVASLGPDGQPQAALVGIAATDRGEVVFDSAPTARKVDNIRRDARVAIVVIAHDEITLQCEGDADLPADDDQERCMDAYLGVYPEGRQRAADGAVLIRVRPRWARIADYRPGSFGVQTLDLT